MSTATGNSNYKDVAKETSRKTKWKGWERKAVLASSNAGTTTTEDEEVVTDTDTAAATVVDTVIADTGVDTIDVVASTTTASTMNVASSRQGLMTEIQTAIEGTDIGTIGQSFPTKVVRTPIRHARIIGQGKTGVDTHEADLEEVRTEEDRFNRGEQRTQGEL